MNSTKIKVTLGLSQMATQSKDISMFLVMNILDLTQQRNHVNVN